MDAVLSALSHRTRRRMLDILRQRPGVNVGALASEFDVSRISIMQHLKVLTDADLVISKPDGRARRLFLNHMPIQMIHARWSDTYASVWSERALDIKLAAEASALNPKDVSS